MTPLSLKSPQDGSLLELSIIRRSEEEREFEVHVETHAFSGRVTASTYHVGSPSVMFRSMAAHWQGWPGEKSWEDLEGRVALSATADSSGHVRLRVAMRDLGTAHSTHGQYNIAYVKSAPMAGFRSAVLSFLERCFGKDHPHYLEFKHQASGDFRSNADDAMGILQAVRDEIAGGWLFNVKGLVAAELFADFISMAEHLLDSGYKDPAAVMAGSVLEEHLRQLSLKASIPVEDERDGSLVPRKADRLNAELAKAEVYSKLDQKLVTAWLDLRNNAAHGKYDAYSSEQVRQLIQGVIEFMARKSL